MVLGQDSEFGSGQAAFLGWRAYDLRKKAIVADIPGGALDVAASADGRILATPDFYTRSDLLVWDLTGIP
ncbi:MAG TPA: hypothetical protein VH092_09160 [Urbifossiella sp.]|nr:hypothetical protein [Urbifossiella sp.]